MEQYLGKKYVQVGSENFEEYLHFMGYSYFARKAAASLRPVNCLTRAGDVYTFAMTSLPANFSLDFRLGEPFEETRLPGGEKIQSIVTIEADTMTHTQTDSAGRTVTHVRTFAADRMIVTTTVDGWDKTATRIYFLVPEK